MQFPHNPQLSHKAQSILRRVERDKEQKTIDKPQSTKIVEMLGKQKAIAQHEVRLLLNEIWKASE